jgi:glutamyl-tRNA synthetase
VIRGSDHISNTPKQLHVYDALGWSRPAFAHCPNIHGSDGSKLSKRHGATDVIEYKRLGFIPEGLLNYIVRLGWAHGDQEVFTIDEMVAAFDLDAVNRSPAVFDMEKLGWVNGEHLRMLPVDTVIAHWRDYLTLIGTALPDRDPAWMRMACDTLRQRHRTLAEMTAAAQFLLTDDLTFNEKDVAQWWKPDSLAVLATALEAFRAMADQWNAPAIHQVLQDTVAKQNIGLKKLAQPIRVAITGTAVSPPIDVSLELLGWERAIARIENAVSTIKAN